MPQATGDETAVPQDTKQQSFLPQAADVCGVQSASGCDCVGDTLSYLFVFICYARAVLLFCFSVFMHSIRQYFIPNADGRLLSGIRCTDTVSRIRFLLSRLSQTVSSVACCDVLPL